MSKIEKAYLIILEKTKDEYSTFVPKINGCGSYGKDIIEAVKNTREALTLHINGMLEEGIDIPIQNIDKVKEEYKNELSMLIYLDKFLLSKLLKTKQKRINITINQGILSICDKKANELNISRSALIENSLIEAIG